MDTKLRKLTVEIVAGYLAGNPLDADDLPTLIGTVYDALSGLGKEEEPPAEATKLIPAVPLRRSVTADYIVCLECGARNAIMKRHLRTWHGMGEEEYRTRWGLPSSYPMVAPNYSTARSNMAKAFGLGKHRSRES